MNKRTALLIISGLVVIGLAIVLIINITKNPGRNIVQDPVGSTNTAPTSSDLPKNGETDQPDTGSQTPAEQPDPDVTPTSPGETDTKTEIPGGDGTTAGILRLGEINVVGADDINVINDLGKDIGEILVRKGDPDYKEIYYASDAYMYSDITYITPFEEGEIIKIFVRAPYKFEEINIGDSVELVESRFGQPYSEGYSEEDGLWLMEYKSEEHNIIFYAESEYGIVVAIGFEKHSE